MNILICDDVSDVALMLKKLIAFAISDVSIAVFNTPLSALDFIRQGKLPDVCFLDIIMPGMDGVTLAENLRKEGYNGPIVFLTTSNEYAAQSYKVNAFSYLLKPPVKEEVLNILRKLEDYKKNNDTAGLPVKTRNISKFILFRDISHVEVIRHNVYFRLADGEEIITARALGEITPALLADKRFAQCHRSFIVNMDNISEIQGNTAVMNCGKSVPISKNYSGFKKQYDKRLFMADDNSA
jgi:DNA-binding LytR/AlgR family response regulator